MASRRPENLYKSGHPAPDRGSSIPSAPAQPRRRKTWESSSRRESDSTSSDGLEHERDVRMESGAQLAHQAARPALHAERRLCVTPARPRGRRDPRALAVHPDDAAILVRRLRAAYFFSRDSGERFVRLQAAPKLSVHFDLDGRSLCWHVRRPRAASARSARRRTDAPVDLPALGQDAVAISRKIRGAIRIRDRDFARSVYLSKDGART